MYIISVLDLKMLKNVLDTCVCRQKYEKTVGIRPSGNPMLSTQRYVETSEKNNKRIDSSKKTTTENYIKMDSPYRISKIPENLRVPSRRGQKMQKSVCFYTKISLSTFFHLKTCTFALFCFFACSQRDVNRNVNENVKKKSMKM